MLPKTDYYATNITDDFEVKKYADKTYKLDIDNYRVQGLTLENKLEAIRQRAYLTLSTERYKQVIYTDSVGCELRSLIGKPDALVCPEGKRFIRESLIRNDDDILNVVNFNIYKIKEYRIFEFTIITNFGDIPMRVKEMI